MSIIFPNIVFPTIRFIPAYSKFSQLNITTFWQVIAFIRLANLLSPLTYQALSSSGITMKKCFLSSLTTPSRKFVNLALVMIGAAESLQKQKFSYLALAKLFVCFEDPRGWVLNRLYGSKIPNRYGFVSHMDYVRSSCVHRSYLRRFCHTLIISFSLHFAASPQRLTKNYWLRYR